LELQQYGAFLGGEIAAEQYTHHLKPEVGTIYLDADKTKVFLKDYRLAKAKNDVGAGTTIELLTRFWPRDTKEKGRKTLTHPLVTYADLIITGDVRNIETANIIKEDHLATMVQGVTDES